MAPLAGDSIECVICGKLIPLEETYLDENGKPVHEDCYVAKLTNNPQPPHHD